MRRLVGLCLIPFAMLVLASTAAWAANSSAQIVNCPPASGCFTPNPIQIKVGDTVTWMNNGSITHTSTSDTGAWDTGPIASGATSSAVSFNTAGTFAYHCSIHPSMTARVIVAKGGPMAGGMMAAMGPMSRGTGAQGHRGTGAPGVR